MLQKYPSSKIFEEIKHIILCKQYPTHPLLVGSVYEANACVS